jgi:hypothetical protein
MDIDESSINQIKTDLSEKVEARTAGGKVINKLLKNEKRDDNI